MSQPKTIRIFVTADQGKVETSYVHAEGINLVGMGPKVAPRVSDIEWDEKQQIWVARLRDGREIARNVNRDIVIQEERDIIDGMQRRNEPIPGFNAPVPGLMVFPSAPATAVFPDLKSDSNA